MAEFQKNEVEVKDKFGIFSECVNLDLELSRVMRHNLMR